ncbi:hypothetical protein EZH22_30760 (plasmid) [Xanthobacter dioxanivorans]|uniref:Uncharacterized protein n=1 Tax=Xanthobacter dioxanivorans TaxID=2528964 RepID=A0A974PUU1_9HYPH|nr:hypothetical protein [Xanthobacter dioxanivorans]QRG10110.1 hypothetical protein EZH22_30760 [Xanthobacter dioxanivorans]
MSSITHRSSTVGRWHTNRRTQTSSRVMDVDERTFHLHVAPLTPPTDAPVPAKTWFFDVTERAHEGVRPIHRGTGYSMEEAKRFAETAVLLASADPSAGAGHFIPVYPAAGIAPSYRRAAA